VADWVALPPLPVQLRM
jgi:hypothetical protein